MSDQLPRIFLTPNQFSDDKRTAYGNKEEFHYLARVLRSKEGKKVILLDGTGIEWLAKISSMDQNKIVFTIIEEIDENREAPIDIVLAQSLCKKDNFELVLQKATELGVKKFIPFVSARTEVVYQDNKKMTKKHQRWSDIIKNAAEQSQRQIIPELTHPLSFENLLKKGSQTKWSYKYICYEKGGTPFKKMLKVDEAPDQPILLIVGPEGGFTDSEIEAAQKHQIQPVTLGPRILRTETAAIAASSLVIYELGDLGGRIYDKS